MSRVRAAVAVVVAVALSAVASVVGAGAASAALVPTIRSVTFVGVAGPGVASPTVTLVGTGFGPSEPPGTTNNVTSCGGYTANGKVYGSVFYVSVNHRFVAGSSNANGAACIGLVVRTWTDTRIVFAFGNAYGTFTRWWLRDGDAYALKVKKALWGGTVTGLTTP